MAEATALRNNALPYPVYGAPYTLVFPILDAGGGLVTGAAGLDSEVSKNGDTFADCTNEATEIATSSGMYYLTLTGTELTADVVSVIVKTTTTAAKTTPITLYPRKLVTLASGTSQGGAAGYITLAAGTVTYDDQYNGCFCVGVLDTLTEARILQDCTASSQQCTVTPSWNTTPDSDDTYIIYLPEGMQVPTANVIRITGTAQTARDIGASVLLSAGTGTGQISIASGLLAWNPAWDAEVESEVDDSLGGGTGTALTAIPWNAAWDAEVQSEVNDELVLQNLDHLLKTATAGVDMTTEVADGSIISRIISNSDTSLFVPATSNLTTLGANVTAIDDYVDTEIAAILADTNELQVDWVNGGRLDLLIDGIKTKTDYLPSVTAGGAGGVFIAGTNAATTVTTALTTTFTGNLTGSVASVAANGITATSLAADAINAASIASGAITNAKFAAGAIDAAAIADNAIDAGAIAADAITAAKIAAGAIDNATFAADVGSTAYATNIIALAADKAIVNAALATATNLATLAGYVDTEVAAILADTNELQTDWVQGGRLDLILDIIAADTTTDIPAELAKVPKSDSNVSWNATALAAINAEVDTALNTAIPGSPTADSINERVATIDTSVALMRLLIAAGTVVDDNDPDPTATAFETNLAEASNDHYNGAFLVFTSGALLEQSRKIAGYVGATKVITTSAFTEAPAGGDTFAILGRSE